jgi:Xaa-Pro aminopeptidase
LRIEEPEFAARRDALAAVLDERGLSGCVLFDPHYVLYYTGFTSSRPSGRSHSSSPEAAAAACSSPASSSSTLR